MRSEKIPDNEKYAILAHQDFERLRNIVDQYDHAIPPNAAFLLVSVARDLKRHSYQHGKACQKEEGGE